MTLEIPEVVINRLPVYARALAELAAHGETVVSSQALGELLDVTPAQIRKDLSYFGRFGKQGRGYNVASLLNKLREILGIDRQWRLCLVGVGGWARRSLSTAGSDPRGSKSWPPSTRARRSRPAGGWGYHPRHRRTGHLLAARAGRYRHCRGTGVSGQGVVDKLVEAGIRAILNYAPITAHVPRDVSIRHIDPVLAMQSMTFYIKRAEPGGK